MRKQPTFHDATTGFPAKKRLKNEFRNSILMTCHHPELGSASNWSHRVGNLLQPIRSTDASSVRLWWRREVSAVFTGYTEAGRSRPLSAAVTILHENSAFVSLQRPAVLKILDE